MKIVICGIFVALSSNASAFVIELNSNNFTVNPTFSSVTGFNFSIDIAEPLQAGTTYNNPMLNGVEYNIGGPLAMGTPSGFPAFSLVRDITGTDFYAQGSSLNFTIEAGADLSDGLQLSELTGTVPIFILNAREVDTGRYHPSLFELNSDGTGQVQNSNNFGNNTPNPSTNQLVNVNFGEEYVSELTFDPATTTIAVPEPSHLTLLSLSGIVFFRRKRFCR